MVPDSLIIYDIAARDGVKSNEVIRLWSKDIPTQPDDALSTGGSRTETCVFDRMFGECRLAQFDDARRYALPVAYKHPFGAVVWVKVPCKWH